ncbi:hypothetical protein ACQJBY_036175 [Aegilops geniculata]
MCVEAWTGDHEKMASAATATRTVCEVQEDGHGLPAGIQGWRARRLGTCAPGAQEVYALTLGARRRQRAPRGPGAAQPVQSPSVLDGPSDSILASTHRKNKSNRENLLWVYMVQTNNKMIVNERFGCMYSQIKVFYLISWITTFQVYADFHNNTAFNFLISPALHTRSKLGGRWLCQAVNAHRQLPVGAVPFFLPLLRCLHGQNH